MAVDHSSIRHFSPVISEFEMSINGMPNIPAEFEEEIIALLRKGGKIPETRYNAAPQNDMQ